MSRVIGLVAFALGGIGLVGCLAGVIAIWMVRPPLLRSSVELLDTADGGLKLVEEKTSRADELLKAIRGVIDPAASKILKLADKRDRTPEDEKELKQIEEGLSQRLGQVDALAEVAETAVTFLNRTSQMTNSLRLPFSQGGAAAESSQDNAIALSRLAKALKLLRENLAKFRENKQTQKEVVDAVVRLSREAETELRFIASRLERVRQRAGEFDTDVAELRTAVPIWTNWAAVIGSVFLVWMGLGQFALLRRGWDRIRTATPK